MIKASIAEAVVSVLWATQGEVTLKDTVYRGRGPSVEEELQESNRAGLVWEHLRIQQSEMVDQINSMWLPAGTGTRT